MSERALAAEVLLRERGVDDGDGLLRVEIVGGERPALEQLLSGDRKETAADLLEVRLRAVALSRYCLPSSSMNPGLPEKTIRKRFVSAAASNSGSAAKSCSTRS